MSWWWLLSLAVAMAGASAVVVATQRVHREQEACTAASEELAGLRPALVAVRRHRVALSEQRQALRPSP